MHKYMRPIRGISAAVAAIALVISAPLAASAEEVFPEETVVETTPEPAPEPVAADPEPAPVVEPVAAPEVAEPVAPVADPAPVDADPAPVVETTPVVEQPAVVTPEVSSPDNSTAPAASVASFDEDSEGSEDTAPTFLVAESSIPKLTPGEPYTLKLAAQDIDGDPVYIFVSSYGSNGGVVFAPTSPRGPGINGVTEVTYNVETPADLDVSQIDFNVKISNYIDFMNAQEVQLKIIVGESLGQAPIANGASVTVPYRASKDVNVIANGLAYDADDDISALKVASVDQPLHGTAVIKDDQTITFTSDGSLYGFEKVKYTITDGKNISVPAEVTVNYLANSVPIIEFAAEPMVAAGKTVIFKPSIHDADVNQSVRVVPDTPSKGSVIIAEDNNHVAYTAPAEVSEDGEVVTLRLYARDSEGLFSTPVDVKIHVLGAPSKADADKVVTGNTLTYEIADEYQGLELSEVQILTQPAHGSAMYGDINSLEFSGGRMSMLAAPAGVGNVITYVPNPGFVGTDSLVYAACYGDTDRVCVSALLTINVTPTVTNPTPSTPVVIPPTTDGTITPGVTPVANPISTGVNTAASTPAAAGTVSAPTATVDTASKLPTRTATTGSDPAPLAALSLLLLAAGGLLIAIRFKRQHATR